MRKYGAFDMVFYTLRLPVLALVFKLLFLIVDRPLRVFHSVSFEIFLYSLLRHIIFDLAAFQLLQIFCDDLRSCVTDGLFYDFA